MFAFGWTLGLAFAATFFNVLDLLALFFAVFFAFQVNTVAAWILFVIGLIFQSLAFSAYLSTAWLIPFIILDILVFIIVILASIRACNMGGSCCTTGCGKKKKNNKGCGSSCGCGCGSSCCSSCCENEQVCKPKKKKCKDNPCHRPKCPTHCGGSGVVYGN